MAGRPLKTFTEKEWNTLKRLCRIFCTLEEAAGVMGMTKVTLISLLSREVGQTWEEFFTEHSAMGRIAVRRAQYQSAVIDRVPAAQIWLGKQYLDQKDKHEVGFDPDKPAVFKVRMGRDLTKPKDGTDVQQSEKAEQTPKAK